MSQFLRDEYLKNFSITEDSLHKINEDIVEITNRANEELRTRYNDDEFKNHCLFRSYIIRFDGKGFQLFEFEKAMRYFEDAKRVERFIFAVDSLRGMTINRLSGKSIDLRLDATDQNNCKLIVQDDDSNWVDAVFCKLKERLTRYKNTNGIVRNRWVPFFIQIIGVVVGFLLSLWVAIKVAPMVVIDNALAFCFIIAFLLFSNTWTVLFEIAIKLLNYFWPNISFKSNGTLHWLVQALISAAFVSMFLFGIGKLFAYLMEIFKLILK